MSYIFLRKSNLSRSSRSSCGRASGGSLGRSVTAAAVALSSVPATSRLFVTLLVELMFPPTATGHRTGDSHCSTWHNFEIHHFKGKHRFNTTLNGWVCPTNGLYSIHNRNKYYKYQLIRTSYLCTIINICRGTVDGYIFDCVTEMHTFIWFCFFRL